MAEQTGGHPESTGRQHVSEGHEGERPQDGDHGPPRSKLDAYYLLIVIATVILVLVGTLIDIRMTR
jgi:hypothetical protein